MAFETGYDLLARIQIEGGVYDALRADVVEFEDSPEQYYAQWRRVLVAYRLLDQAWSDMQHVVLHAEQPPAGA